MIPVTDIRNMHDKTFDFLLFRLGAFLWGVAAEQVIRIGRGEHTANKSGQSTGKPQRRFPNITRDANKRFSHRYRG